MFRVKAQTLKIALKDRAVAVKNYLIEAVEAWCKEKIIYINGTF
jgi:hypothetical protein